MTRMTIADLLNRCAFKFPDQEAIISEAGWWTFRQGRINANRRAAAMLKQGIGKEDHVATIFLNGKLLNQRSLPGFQQAIDAKLKEKK